MTDHPLYLPASLIPAFAAGRVFLLVEPLDVLDGAHSPEINWAHSIVAFKKRSGALWEVPLPYLPGDRLWLREAWACHSYPKPGEYAYLADPAHRGGKSPGLNWMFAEEMPMRISRAWAEVEEVRVKRVQDVTEGECEAAGFSGFMSLDGSDCESPREQLQDHFHYTYGPDAWDRNPWCAFTQVKPHMGSLEGKG